MVFYVLLGLVLIASWTALVAGLHDAEERQSIKTVARRLSLSFVGGLVGAALADMSLLGAVVGTAVVYFLDSRFKWSDRPSWSL